jgi:hypothetical protein
MVKNALLILSIITLKSCFLLKSQNDSIDKNKFPKKEIINNTSSCDYYNIFDSFVENLINKNSVLVSNYTVLSHNNFWTVVDFNLGRDGISRNTKFSRKDFLENFDSIFSTEFIDCATDLLNKDFIKSKKDYSSRLFYSEDGNFENYQMFSSFNSKKERLTLTMYYEFLEDGEKYETTINYIFLFMECEIILEEIIMAD